MRLIAFFSILLLLAFTVRPEEAADYPTDYFRSPVGQPLRLSGTFGELRANHFHSGIDIKGAIGQTLYAAADGYVARIRVQKDGYGNCIYLQHPNGYTTVYAHMNNFAPELEAFIKEQQYKDQTFEVELFPEKDRFFFKKGAAIGAMGTTGSSFGPHLHFEIRDSRSEKPINPLLFGLEVPDRRPPRMHQLRVYALNDKLETVEAKTYDLLPKGNQYSIAGEVLTIGAWRAGFGIKVYDHMDEVPNWNGIYELKMYVDGQLVYHFDAESFSFSETRYLNAHLDYEQQVAARNYFNRCYRLPGNRLSMYGQCLNEGVVKLYKDQTTTVTIVAGDLAGNESRLEFKVRRGEVDPPAAAPYNYVLQHDEANVIDNYSINLHFPEGSFYEDLYMNYRADKERSSNIYSDVHSVHDYRTPVHRYFDIAIRPTILPDELKSKAFIAYCDERNRITNYGGAWENGMLKTRVRDLGDFYIMVDTSPPKIRPVAFQSNMKGHSKMSFRISDDYATAGNARELTYQATVDGQWILMKYDEKNDLLFHEFDGRLTPGSHELRLVVSDGLKNEAEYSATFTL